MTGSCVVYCRVSTSMQAAGGSSLEQQESAGLAWAASRGLSAEVFRDEGLSGRDMSSRPGVSAAVARAKALGCPLVVLSLSRLGRSLVDLVVCGEALAAAGADLVSLSESIDTSTAGGKMVFRMLCVLAQFERELVGERMASCWAYRRGVGLSCPTRTGERVEGGRLVPDPPRVEALAEIRRLKALGRSNRRIARELNAAGMRAPRGGEWFESTVRAIVGRAA